MARHIRRERSADQPWEIENVSDLAQAAAIKAAADMGAPLGIWLSDTVLRATQEGIAPAEEMIVIAAGRRPSQ